MNPLAERILAYRADPLRFVIDALKVDPTPQQREALAAIGPAGAHVSVRSGHGTGKSAVLSWAILWFLFCFRDCKVPCTAPTAHQLFDVLWSELAKWRQRIVPALRADVVLLSDSISVVGEEQTRFAVARTARADNPEALQGFHARNLLFVVDEASGVDDRVFEVAEGSLSTPGARILMMSNPTRTDGFFYRSHTKDRAFWKTFRFSSAESPLVSPAFAADLARRYGESSNIYRVRVLGEFPEASEDVLIPLAWIESAFARDIAAGAARRVAGLDVARYGGDRTALVVRAGGVLQHARQWSGTSLMETTGRVVAAYKEKLFDAVNVDVIGIGAGVVDRLQELSVPVTGVNVAETSPHNAERFNRLRDELWWGMREWFEAKACRIAPEIDAAVRDELAAQLSEVRYGFTSAGKVKIESKDEMRARGKQSPDLADALGLTFAPVRASSALALPVVTPTVII